MECRIIFIVANVKKIINFANKKINKMKTIKRKLISIADFSDKRNVAKSNIYRWIANGYIEVYKVEGSIFIDENDLIELPKIHRGRPFASSKLKAV